MKPGPALLRSPGFLRPLLVVVACALLPGSVARAVQGEPATSPDPNPGLFAYDKRAPLDAVATPFPVADSTTRVDLVEYTTFDGTRVPGLFLRPTGARTRGACLIVQHGLGGNKGDMVAALPQFVGMGYGVLAIDAREHGARGSVTDGVNAAHDPVLLEAMLRETVIDLRRGIDVLTRRAECDRRRIGYVGYSMGGMLGALLAGADRRVKAPALVLAGGDWQVHFDSRADVFLPGIRDEPERLLTARALLDPVDPVRWAGRISPRPVLVIGAREDLAIVPAMVDALFQAARDPKQVVWLEGGHLLFGPYAAAAHDALAAWFTAHLPAQRTPR